MKTLSTIFAVVAVGWTLLALLWEHGYKTANEPPYKLNEWHGWAVGSIKWIVALFVLAIIFNWLGNVFYYRERSRHEKKSRELRQIATEERMERFRHNIAAEWSAQTGIAQKR
jgi:hypothetical protein